MRTLVEANLSLSFIRRTNYKIMSGIGGKKPLGLFSQAVHGPVSLINSEGRGSSKISFIATNYNVMVVLLVSYLLLHNKLPPTQQLSPITTDQLTFQGLRTWGALRQMGMAQDLMSCKLSTEATVISSLTGAEEPIPKITYLVFGTFQFLKDVQVWELGLLSTELSLSVLKTQQLFISQIK